MIVEPLDKAIARLATAQHGLVTLGQLAAIGLTPSGVRSRVERGRLRRVHRGVYATGHARLSRAGRLMAAVLACGADAVLSHRSAAELHELLPTSAPWIDVTAPRRRGRGRPGIRVHAAVALRAADVCAIDGVPCTALARTMLDVAGSEPRRTVERACDRAALGRILDVATIDAALDHTPTHPGAAALRAVLRDHRVGSTATRSELEERFLALCRAGATIPDAVNLWISLPGGGAEVDFAWRESWLIAEVDGHAWHGTRRAFEHDRRRDQQLMTLGWRVARFTWRQVVDDAGAVAATLRQLLEQPSGVAQLGGPGVIRSAGRA